MNSTAIFAIMLSVVFMSTASVFMRKEGNAAALASNFVTYRNAVNSYALHHTGTGSIADSALDLPAGFNRDPKWSNRVTASTVYVFGPAEPAVIEEAGKQLRCSSAVGVNIGSELHNACNYRASGVAVPSFVPLGALTSVIER